jgi:hypothetical protein
MMESDLSMQILIFLLHLETVLQKALVTVQILDAMGVPCAWAIELQM